MDGRWRGKSSRIAYLLLVGIVGLMVGGERRPGGPLWFFGLLGALDLVGSVSFHSWKNSGGGISQTIESVDGGESTRVISGILAAAF